MRPDLVVPPKVPPGSRVAVVSPSFAAPGAYPHVHELAMRRLRDDLGLIPVEYPTTRQLGAAPQARAADLMAAFTDPSIAAVLATIGGDDQLTVLPYLDADLVTANPKAFAGYSDNTNLLNWLWNCGIAGFYGGSTMVHLGRGPGLHPLSLASLRAALLDGGDLELRCPDRFSEDELDWADAGALCEAAPTQPAQPWLWQGPAGTVTAPTWGGNLEVWHWNLAAGRWIRPAADYAGCVLLLETSEELPSAREVFRMLRDAGERGLLEQFPAVLVGRPKASFLHTPRPPAQREQYRREQREAVVQAFDRYAPDAMIVFNVDFGHTDPQYVLPYGGPITVDGTARRIVAHY